MVSPAYRAALLAALLTLSGSGTRAEAPVPASHGTLEVRVTDHREAIEDFARLDLLVEAIEIHPVGEPRQRGWIELAPTAPGVDLTQVTRGRHAVIFAGSVPARSYDAIRLQARLGEFVHREGRAVSIKADLSPILLRFPVQTGLRTVATLDLVLQDLSDHPGKGYELHIKQARAEGPA